MTNKVKFCKKCRENMEPHFFGYWPINGKCPKCKVDIPEIDLTWDDFYTIKHVAENVEFYEAMIDLKDKDIIEYELKMSQFRNQLNQQKTIKNKQQQLNVPHCPYCNSTDIKKISGAERIASTTMFGIFSKKIGKSFKCNNCDGTF